VRNRSQSIRSERPSQSIRSERPSQSIRSERPRYFNSALPGSRRGPSALRRARAPQEDQNPSLPNRQGRRAGPVPPAAKPELKGFWGTKERKPLSTVPQGNEKQRKPLRQKKVLKVEAKEEEIKPMTNEKVTTVVIEGQVILQIMKHARSHETKSRSGLLRGLKKPESKSLEVTYAIATPDDSMTRTDDQQFARRMLECLESTNIDRMDVGWYRTCVNSNFYDEDTIIRCAQWQDCFHDAVMLVYDSRATQHGRLSLRAYQLKKKFFDLFTSRKVGHSAFSEAGIGYDDILREIPVKIHNSYIVHAFLYDLQNIPNISCDYDRLTHWRNSQLSHNLTAMEHSIEDYYNLQNEYRKWLSKVNAVRRERDRLRAKCDSRTQMDLLERNLPLPDEPSRMRSVLSCAQMNEVANSMFGSITQMQAKTLIQSSIISES